ncbi:FkbM family methyltransferase [Polynucleobacter yangtzensis]|uniref:FkbM family methyltransferase n=1 Tax=Polynucleobacter yangtzensis TaxID=1743159 RepID=UPI000832EF44|nr:FkbM family methyltransferase [Polynucleobacter yangtzensis]
MLERIKKLKLTTEARTLQHIKDKVCKYIKSETKCTVIDGPFRGLKLSEDRNWGNSNDLTTQILGTYEREIVDLIALLSSPNGVFIDIGGANGFYAVGVAKCLSFSSVYVYELSAEGRREISINAVLNDVDPFIKIGGKFDNNTVSQDWVEAKNSTGVILIDIEGGEFELMNPEFFSVFSRFNIIVELHDFLDPNTHMVDVLIQNSNATHEVKFLRNNGRNPASINLLNHLPEDYQWIACSESRLRAMSWAHFIPKVTQA